MPKHTRPSLVILDRDGVINEDSPNYIRSPDEWHPIPGSLEAIARLNAANIDVAIATNQSGIARGYYDQPTYEAIQAKLSELLSPLGGKIRLTAFCPHLPDAGCHCRKPLPGMLHHIAEQTGQALEGVPFVGDSYRDLEAGWAAGCSPQLVLTGNGHNALQTLQKAGQDVPVYTDLKHFVDFWLS